MFLDRFIRNKLNFSWLIEVILGLRDWLKRAGLSLCRIEEAIRLRLVLLELICLASIRILNFLQV